ncbi:hypothetical protein BJ878DRAFT_493315 [Calycina marina]|uniref:Uncharacterized protein n=1 Tax=Calycina marina TaxID=1763456 RepID=A0A9P7Z8M9_9HELO|nr:hypothetical protein BJ878DRAFT_493315 [Calycina marina]
MSSDLLAEFDSFYRAPSSYNKTNQTSVFATQSSSNDTGGKALSGSSLQWPDFNNTKGGKETDAARVNTGLGQPGFLQQWTNGSSSQAIRPTSASFSSSAVTTNEFIHPRPNSVVGGARGLPQKQIPPPVSNDDIWGGMSSFQPAQKTKEYPQTYEPKLWGAFSSPSETVTKSQTSRPDRCGTLRRPTLDLFSTSIANTAQSPQLTADTSRALVPARQQSAAFSKSPFGEVFFDADEMGEDEDIDDDFGDFESVTPAPIPQPQRSGLAFGNNRISEKPQELPLMPSSPYLQGPKSPPFQKRNSFAELDLSTKSTYQPSPIEPAMRSETLVTAWPTYETNVLKQEPFNDAPTVPNQHDDDWGDFADFPLETPEVPKIDSGLDGSWGWDAVEAPASSKSAAELDLAPPTNIPPPSVLLAHFPSIFGIPQSALFKPVANQTFPLKNRIISDPSTIDFLRAYLLLACVAAHVVVGRKLRWKRDTILSQSMSIGPAVVGGRSGMKLAGVDKTEVTKGDREAAEVIRTWKDQLGRLRSVIAVANSSLQDSSKHLAIPDVSESMHIKTQPNALTAPKPCVVCGLKREERVYKVDVDIEDSFGEWWVDHWGHRTCRNFWIQNQANLNQR